MPRLLDLFCGAGGAAMGYSQAGFTEILGVDHLPQPHYPFPFVQADALAYLAAHGRDYEVIHCSPPCQGYSNLRYLPWMRHKTYPRLLDEVDTLCRATGAVYVIENVAAAPLDGLVLCGLQVGLPLYRHRRFASKLLVMTPPHPAHPRRGTLGRQRMSTYRRGGGQQVTGVLGTATDAEAMGIDWMTPAELSQAIPPAYTRLIGQQVLAALGRAAEGTQHRNRPDLSDDFRTVPSREYPYALLYAPWPLRCYPTVQARLLAWETVQVLLRETPPPPGQWPPRCGDFEIVARAAEGGADA